MDPFSPIDPTEPDTARPLEARHLGAVEHERLRQSVYRRVFGASSPVELGRFTVLERIGSGGMGLVFKAYDMQLDRKVAVKVIRIDGASDSARRALVKEARALARLSHPNVVHVYEVGEGKGGELYLAMEFVEGVTLRDWIARAQRGWREIVEVCLQAADGLAAAHAASLVHRDFKPDNVMVGDDARVRVLDFGLARTKMADLRPGITLDTRPELFTPLMTTVDRVHGVAGTPAYMAPEQITLGEVGPAADQFAFCASLFEALYGVRPFEGASLAELRDNIAAGKLTVPERRCGVPKPLHRAIVQGLASQPSRRHASMQVLIGEIRRARLGQRVRKWMLPAALAVTTTFGGLVLIAESNAPSNDPQEDELAMTRAELELANDPSAAIRAMSEMSDHAPAWHGRAFAVAEQADLWGLADHEVRFDESFEFLAVAGDRVIGYREHEHAMVATHVRDATTTALLSGVASAPTMPGLRVDGAPALQTGLHGRFAVLTDDDGVEVIDVETGRRTNVDAHPSVQAVAFAEDGSAIALREHERIAVFGLPDGHPLFEAPVPSEGSSHVVFALDAKGTRLAVGAYGGSTLVHRIDGGPPLELPKADPGVMTFANADVLVVAGPGSGLHAWNLTDGSVKALGASPLRHMSLHVARGGDVLVSRTDGDGIHVRDLRSGKLHRFAGADTPNISRDGNWAAWRTEDGRITVLDLTSMTERRLVTSTPLIAHDFTSDSSGIVGYADDRSARHWPLVAESPVLQGHTENIVDLQFARDGNGLFSAARDMTLRRWDLETGTSTVVARIVDPIGMDISGDGRLIAIAGAGGITEVWTVDAGELLLRTDPGAGGNAKFHGDELYVAGDDGIDRIDVATGARTTVIDEKGCHAFAIDESGTRLAASCSTRVRSATVRTWELPTGAPVDDDVVADWRVAGFLGHHGLVGGPFAGSLAILDLVSGAHQRVGHGQQPSDVEIAAGTLAIADSVAGVELHDVVGNASAAVPGTEDATIVAIARDGSRVAFSRDHRTISVRARHVPHDSAELRDWVREHRLESIDLR